MNKHTHVERTYNKKNGTLTVASGDAGAGAGVLKKGRVGSKPGVGVSKTGVGASKTGVGVSKTGVGGSEIFVHDLHAFQYKNNTWNLKIF